jgi:Putative peptidoglycan binding domain/L,D-transpeptidase catalytic domain
VLRIPRLLRDAAAALSASACVLVGVVSPSSAATAPAVAAPAAVAPATTGLAAGVAGTPLTFAAAPTTRPRYARETVRPGARDTGPYSISHVYEVQIRLTWVGAYHGPLTGYFGPLTRAAVTSFQRGQRLPQTGVVDARTWSRLIPLSTTRHGGWRTLPAACRRPGWHTCYSRPTHELFTLNNNTLWNAWLVRGGAAGLQTVRGTFRVYWQDLHHRSSIFNNAPMPYSQFFYGGEAIHGSGTMVNPLSGHSHGCINMYIEDAAELWRLTAHRANTVTVYGAWA